MAQSDQHGTQPSIQDAALIVVGGPGISSSCARLFSKNGMRVGVVAHRRAGKTIDDNMADPDRIAETYLQLHRQHRSTWAFEVVLRPWVERW
jgi:hypothetical protein